MDRLLFAQHVAVLSLTRESPLVVTKSVQEDSFLLMSAFALFALCSFRRLYSSGQRRITKVLSAFTGRNHLFIMATIQYRIFYHLPISINRFAYSWYYLGSYAILLHIQSPSTGNWSMPWYPSGSAAPWWRHPFSGSAKTGKSFPGYRSPFASRRTNDELDILQNTSYSKLGMKQPAANTVWNRTNLW